MAAALYSEIIFRRRKFSPSGNQDALEDAQEYTNKSDTDTLLGDEHIPGRLGASYLKRAIHYDALMSTDPPTRIAKSRILYKLRKHIKHILELISNLKSAHTDALPLLTILSNLYYISDEVKDYHHTRIMGMMMSGSSDGESVAADMDCGDMAGGYGGGEREGEEGSTRAIPEYELDEL
mmetsp:Transcript_43897/g.93440  ORF Transcript_43897/g.93440 Transcript_43897/m.93440 type:complete len:179 (-) Transcript_43897:855-1391(-)